jgi:hypothetical protein
MAFKSPETVQIAWKRQPISAQVFENEGCLRSCRRRSELSGLGGGARRNRTDDLFNAIVKETKSTMIY